MKKWTLWFALASLLFLPACGGDDKTNNGSNNNGSNENNNGNGENNNGNGENNNGNGENNDKLFCDTATTKAKCQTLNGSAWAFSCNNGVVSQDTALNCTEDGFTCFTDNDTNPTEAWCGCTTNEQCAAVYPDDAPYCNISTNSCGECRTSDDCAADEICDEYGFCAPGSSGLPVSCEGLTDYYNCKTDSEGHEWLVLCQDGQLIDVDAADSDIKTMDCTAAGSKCVDGWFGSKMCGCETAADCASGFCTSSGRCEPINDNPDALCVGRENLGFCETIGGVLTAVACENGLVDEDWTFTCDYDGNIYCDTYDDGDGYVIAFCTDEEPAND